MASEACAYFRGLPLPLFTRMLEEELFLRG